MKRGFAIILLGHVDNQLSEKQRSKTTQSDNTNQPEKFCRLFFFFLEEENTSIRCHHRIHRLMEFLEISTISFTRKASKFQKKNVVMNLLKTEC